jgi:hypothetical protein
MADLNEMPILDFMSLSQLAEYFNGLVAEATYAGVSNVPKRVNRFSSRQAAYDRIGTLWARLQEVKAADAEAAAAAAASGPVIMPNSGDEPVKARRKEGLLAAWQRPEVARARSMRWEVMVKVGEERHIFKSLDKAFEALSLDKKGLISLRKALVDAYHQSDEMDWMIYCGYGWKVMPR